MCLALGCIDDRKARNKMLACRQGHQFSFLWCLVRVKSLSPVRLFATPWTVAYQDPLSMVFSRQEYWSGLPYPSPGDLPDPGIEPRSPTSPADILPSEPPGKPKNTGVVAYPFSRGTSCPWNRTRVSSIIGRSLPAELPGKPIECV